MAIALSDSIEDNNIASTSSQISSEAKKGTAEMIGGCSVCSDDQGTEDNPLVYCDGCELAVHQACYGIVQVPPGSWFCGRCEAGETQDKIRCELCPNGEGALKKTEAGSWAHVVCALYIPEVVFGNNNTMEPIIIKFIKPDRYNKNCYLCQETENPTRAAYGAVMDCHKASCKQSFHVTCAQAAGLLCEEAGQGSDNLVYCGYCKHHFRKLKAGNRKQGNSLNGVGSSYLDSASDSSQDNDSRCNETENDKNSNRANSRLSCSPANLSSNDVLASSNLKPPASSSSRVDSISLTVPINSTNSNSTGKKNSSLTSYNTAPTPQKKKKAPKTVQNSTSSGAPNTLPTTLLATASGMQASTQALAKSVSNLKPSEQASTSGSIDVYEWSSSGKESEKGSNSTNKTNKKKTTPSQPSSAKQLALSSNNSTLSVTSNYNPIKIGSPNLSLSTSPSLTSPSSNSTKSTSNSSTSSLSNTTTSSSTTATPSSNFSNSPSPALLSPNVSSKTLSTPKLEPPTSSSSKKNDSLLPKLNTQVGAGSTLLSSFQNSTGSDGLNSLSNSTDQRTISSGSSLLSAVVPNNIEQFSGSLLGPSMTNGRKSDNSPSQALSLPETCNNNIKDRQNNSSLDSADSANNPNVQPTVPPLIIPIPQNSSSLTAVIKSTAKAKPSAKSSKKKPVAEVGEEKPKPEPKPKASRSKKVVNVTPPGQDSNAPKSETKRPSKSKANSSTKTSIIEPTNSNATTTIAITPTTATSNMTVKPTPTVPQPAKRKSRSISNDSNNASPSPTKRVRKKKTDQPTPSQNGQSVTNCSTPMSNMTLLSTSSTAPINTGPLMINAPPVNSRLMPGQSPVESQQNAGTRYFTPIVSPYANLEQQYASSLSRSSLSRLFTASSADNNLSHTTSADDPTKAFEELQEEIWGSLHKNILEQAQQFDIPSQFGLLYSMRTENDKLVNRVRDLKMKFDQTLSTVARLELPGPVLVQHLNNTSPNFSAVVSNLANSPKGMTTPSPSTVISKPSVPVGSYNHINQNPMGHSAYIDRSSPLINPTNPGLNNIKPSVLSTPSPPRGSMMAHSNSNRSGLITVNPPYMSGSYPPISSIGQIGANPQNPYYSRQ